MRLKLPKVFALTGFVFLFSGKITAQSFSFNCTRDTIIPGCGINICFTLKGVIPDLHGLSNTYTINPTSSIAGCFPVYGQPNDPAGTPTALSIDDTYSSPITMGFPFPFYGTIYNSLIASTNGFLSFDISNAGGFADWSINNDLPSTAYDRAMIMGPMHDLNPNVSQPTQRIQYQVFGLSPHRRWILSFYKVPLFGSACTGLIENTHQIILYESTGIIEVAIFSKQICTGWNSGRAIVGIQDWNRTQGMMAPGRAGIANAPWGSIGMNESWRFVPGSGPSLFRRVELYDLAGTLIMPGTVTNLGNGRLEASFPNFCPAAGGTNSYIIKSVYQKIDDPATEIFGTDTVRITRDAFQQANILSSGTSCSGANNGSITVTPTNGTAPYTYSIDGAPAVAGPAPYTFTNVSSGLHSIVVFDASGCASMPLQASVVAGPPITTTASKTDALCNGGATGTITVAQPTVGSPPFEYSLDGTNWQTSNVFTGLVAGIYTVYFRESSGCNGDLSITVAEPTVLASAASTVPVVCNAQSNGIITASASGGVSPYEYSINGTTWQSSNIFNVPAGVYTIHIRDFNGCTSTQNIAVTEPAVLMANSVNTTASCDGGNDGTIVVTANGGNSSYTYSIDGINFQSANQFNVAPGNYTVTVKDNLGCTTSFPTVVGLTDNMTWTPQTDPTICESKSVQLQLNSNATQYAWSPATGLSNATIYNPVANPVVTTQYIVTGTLGRCSHDDTVLVNVNTAPVPNAGPDGFICYGQNYRLQASGGTQYTWSPSTYLDNTAVGNPLSTPPKDIVYTLSIMSDANGCASLVTDDMRIDVTPPIKVKTYPYDTIGYPGDQFQLLAVPSDSDVINYSWNPTIGLSNPNSTTGAGSLNIPNPVVTVGAIGEDIQYQVIASTIAGCRGEGYIKVRIYKGPDIYVPTGFSPNNDGKNDKFTPFPVGMKSYNYFRVFNRWGQLLFSTTKLNGGWDGRFGGVEQGSGVYVWMIEGLTKDSRVISKKGTVMLIR